MQNIRNWSPKRVIKFLENQDFCEVHRKGKGSHRFFYNDKLKAFVLVSMSKNPIPIGTMAAIIKQSKMDKSVWMN